MSGNDRQPTDVTVSRREARPTATTAGGDVNPLALRFTRNEMATDAMAEDLRQLVKRLDDRNARATRRADLIKHVLQAKVLLPIGVILLGAGVLAGGGSLAYGDFGLNADCDAPAVVAPTTPTNVGPTP